MGRGAVRTLPFDGLSGGGGRQPVRADDGVHREPAGGRQHRLARTAPVLKSAQQQLNGSSQFVLDYCTDLGTFNAGQIIAVRDNGEIEAATSAQPVHGLDDQAARVLPERRCGRP